MTDAMPPQIQFDVGVVIERRRSASPWIDFAWTPVAVLPGRQEAQPWTVLSDEDGTTRFYAGATTVTLYRTESGHYRDNLLAAAPSLWAALRPTGGEPPYELVAATVDPAEGESFTQAGQDLVAAVPLPQAIRDLVGAFVDAHPPRALSYKRRRDGAGAPRMGKADVR
jgi:hypothetical protein